MATRGGTNRPGGRSKPAKYSGARVHGTLGGYSEALGWHQRGPAEDAPSTGRRRKPPKPALTGCAGERRVRGVMIRCGLPAGHTTHAFPRLFEKYPALYHAYVEAEDADTAADKEGED